MTPERWQQVKAVLQGALDRAESQRAAFLDEACAGDPSLRAEVESLLAVQEPAADFIETPALAEATTVLKEDLDESLAGHRIGPYKILHEIGQGGMGAVYMAVRADDEYQKRVAIKLLKRGMDTGAVVRRFRHERQILAGLDHPNIAKLLDGGTDRGLPYFVMDYIEGLPIDTYCDQHKLPTAERLHLFRTVCAAVHYAHQNLVVHRDLKPSNILVAADGTPKLLDFGIAKLLNPELHPHSLEPTAAALHPMTPAYASPEQVRGETVTTASDVYSLGVLLYELLTGHRPYRFKTHQPQEIERVLSEQEPEKPSTAVTRVEEVPSGDGTGTILLTPERVSQTRDGQPEKLRRQLTGDLDNIVLMAMRKEPARRYASVAQLSEDIRRHLEGRPVIARKDTLGYRGAKFVRRNKMGVAAAALVAVALLAGLAATAWQARVARMQRAKAERRFNDVRKLANTLLFSLHDAIEKLPGSTPARALLVQSALEYLDSLAREAGDDPSLQQELATAYQKVGDIQGYPYAANLGDTTGARQSFLKALAIRQALSAKDPRNAQIRRDLISSYNKIGDMAWAAGNLAGARQNYQEAMAVCQAWAADEPASALAQHSLSVCHERIGDTLAATGDMAGALENQRQAQSLRETLVAKDPANRKERRDLSVTYEKVGDALAAAGDTVGALENYRRSLTLREALASADPQNGPARRDLLLGHVRMGNIRVKTGEMAEALESYRRALAIAEGALAADPLNMQSRRDLSLTHDKVGEVRTKMGDMTGAREDYRRALALRELLSANDPANAGLRSDLSTSYNNIGDLLAQTGEWGGALENYRRALAIREALVEKNPLSAEMKVDLAVSYGKMGQINARLTSERAASADRRWERWRAARSWYQRSLDLWRDLQRRGQLSGEDAGRPDEVARELAKCDTALTSEPTTVRSPRRP